MIGVVIADLAAWTYEHDRKCFYEKLVSPEARLYGFGLLVLSMWKTINEGGLIIKHRFYSEIGKALAHADLESVEMPTEWRHWGQSDYESPIPSDLNTALIVSAIMDSGFLSEERHSQLDWASFFHGDKQEYYATYLMTILRHLNEGKTKDEAIADIPNPVINYYPSGIEHKWKELLEYTTFAWRCFYYSWDFTSAIHNAAKCTGNRRLAMVLTGAFAGAMYGYTYNLIKQKFKAEDNPWPEMIGLPPKVVKSYGDVIQEMSKDAYTNRFF